jgi:uncharacterized protein
MTLRRFAIFLTIVLSVWLAMHGYVFWRLASVPWVAGHVSRPAIIWTAVLLAAGFPLARVLNMRGFARIGLPLEFLAANWVGVVFLLFALLAAADLITFGGWLFPGLAPSVRGAAAIVAILLAAIGFVQGCRPPVVTEHEVRLAGFPEECDGLVLVAISDLHLGNLIGERWMKRLVERVDALKPDVVAIVGDLVDSEVGRLEGLIPVLRTLRAPLGVWAVTGNHEYYAGLDRSVALLEAAGFSVLRDRATEITAGVVFAGVDDLGARRRFSDDRTIGGRAGTDRPREPGTGCARQAVRSPGGPSGPALPSASDQCMSADGGIGQAMERALVDRQSGAVVLLSHSPLLAEKAAALGVGLMLSGHTHGGQIWPFNYLVRLSNPLVGGRYEICGMSVIVGRGTGTWGPRMRLWRPSEILRITLRPG